MNLISSLDFIGFIGALYALIIVFLKNNNNFVGGEKKSLYALLIITIIINFKSFYEWADFTDIAEFNAHITDFLQIVQPAFWGLFFYIFILSKSQNQLENSYKQMRSIVEQMPVILQAIDCNGNIIAWNDKAKRITGYSLEDLNKDAKLNNFFTQDEHKTLDIDLFNQEHDTSSAHRNRTHKIIPMMCHNGELRQIAWYKTPKNQAIPGWEEWGVGFDISNEIQIQNRLHYMATHDVLTNLPNLNLLQQCLKESIYNSSINDTLCALLLIDIDNFKIINDTIGHDLGNELIVKLSHVLLQSVEGIERVFRLGGDEFYILLENKHSKDQIESVLKNVYTETAKPITLSQGANINLTLSIGVSIYPEDSQSPEDMIQHADLAMYSVKDSGRNRHHYFSAPMKESLQRQKHIYELLRHAIHNDELELYYQPQVNLSNAKIEGVEALLRWHPSDGSAISPAEFIPVAERFGLIDELGTWVMQRCCTQIKQWQCLWELNSIAVNISAEQFYKDGFADKFIKIATDLSIPLNKIDLEITEGLLLNDTKKAIKVMNKLRTAGFQLSLDDFGTGYSSLAYLKRFPITKIKIDRAFIQHIDSDQTNQAIVKSIIELGHNLDKRIVAEGIEREQEYQTLVDYGCNYVQGYLYSPPIAIEKLESWLQQYSQRQASSQS